MMQSPGRVSRGWVDPDHLHDAAGFVYKVVQYFKKEMRIDLKNTDSDIVNGIGQKIEKTEAEAALELIYQNYRMDMEKDTYGEALNKTRVQVEKLQAVFKKPDEPKPKPTVTGKFLDLLQNVKNNPSAMAAIGNDELVHDVWEKVWKLEEAAGQALYELPDSGRWDDVLPDRNLIQSLAAFYEDVTGEPARDNIIHSTDCGPEEYGGDFFSLIESLKIRDGKNATLGKFILRCLEK